MQDEIFLLFLRIEIDISKYIEVLQYPVGMDSIQGRAQAFKALGDPTRLQIFEYLYSCAAPVEVDEAGDARPVCGSTVGEVCCHLLGDGRISSTISFHLKELRLAGLITMERRGKNILCAPVPEAAQALERYFGQIAGCKEGLCR